MKLKKKDTTPVTLHKNEHKVCDGWLTKYYLVGGLTFGGEKMKI